MIPANILPPVVVLALLAIEAELAVGPVQFVPLRVAIAVALVFLLPGAALTRVLGSTKQRGLGEQFALSLGLSIASMIVGGVLLNFLSVGMQPLTWLGYAALVTVLALLWSAKPTASAAVLGPATVSRAALPRPAAITAALIAIVLAGAFTIAIVGAKRHKGASFSALWLSPEKAANTYQLGVANESSQPAVYMVKLAVAGAQLASWQLNLPTGAEWHRDLQLTPPGPIKATLFKGLHSRTPFRTVIYRSPSG